MFSRNFSLPPIGKNDLSNKNAAINKLLDHNIAIKNRKYAGRTEAVLFILLFSLQVVHSQLQLAKLLISG
jgi:hypothetical protein